MNFMKFFTVHLSSFVVAYTILLSIPIVAAEKKSDYFSVEELILESDYTQGVEFLVKTHKNETFKTFRVFLDATYGSKESLNSI